MFTRKDEARNGNVAMKLENRLLRLLRSEMGFQASLVIPESNDQDDHHNGFEKELGKAMLDFERDKSRAIMTTQQNQNYS